MVNGNYILYGDRPSSESEIVEDHVHARTVERKARRKANRSANELQYSLNLAQLDNETDSVKYEKKTKEPRLLRYVPTTDVEEHYVSEKFETYDLKPTEEPPRRYTFAKKPKNPTDGSVNYAYSRSSSSCSSPNGNLPTISEQCEQYGTYRIKAIRTADEDSSNTYETKLDKYFSRPRDVKTFVAKGSHPDSLYRVPMGNTVGSNKIVRVLRVLRWPVALFSVCIALAIFVYFLMPDNLSTEFDTVNATTWQRDNSIAQSHRNPEKPVRKTEGNGHSSKGNTRTHGTKPQEIDFYDAESATGIDLTSLMETVTQRSEKVKVPAIPVFPTHITPEVQYGNEKVVTGKIRNPKLIDETKTNQDESTLKPHITQSPEKPLAIYFDEGKVVAASTTETITRAETSNDVLHYDEKLTTKAAEVISSKAYAPVYKDASLYMRNDKTNPKEQTTEPELPPEIHNYYQLSPLNPNHRFTSGHSKLFGISIEDAQNMKSTTQSSLYNTRVSPTLPTWRDKVDSTTKNYQLNVNLDVSHCRSTQLAICRGVLPYDLAGPSIALRDTQVTELLPQIEYLVATNCSERVAQLLCALLEPECSPAPYPPKLPCYNLCRAVAESCEGAIPRELVSLFSCSKYPSNGCAGARTPCGPRELPCADASCVPTQWVCDGTPDCPSGDDEAHCTGCGPNEFQCSSGGCVRSRWVCDGYTDCPRGEDESETVCARRPQEEDADVEPGEESAGSAPALAVRRPNNFADISIHRAGEVESSKELLMTSDSNNAFKRNFTRRPLPARLTPYSRPMIHDTKTANDKAAKKVDEEEASAQTRSEVKVTKSYSDSTKRKQVNAANKLRARNMPVAADPTMHTHLDKSIHNLERVINGAAMMKKVAEAAQEEMIDSSEGKMESMEKVDEPLGRRKSGHYEASKRAHASPCPSGNCVAWTEDVSH